MLDGAATDALAYHIRSRCWVYGRTSAPAEVPQVQSKPQQEPQKAPAEQKQSTLRTGKQKKHKKHKR